MQHTPPSKSHPTQTQDIFRQQKSRSADLLVTLHNELEELHLSLEFDHDYCSLKSQNNPTAPFNSLSKHTEKMKGIRHSN